MFLGTVFSVLINLLQLQYGGYVLYSGWMVFSNRGVPPTLDFFWVCHTLAVQ